MLYRLPEIKKARYVFVLEGCKDCETARKWGLVATTNPNGAKSPWGAEHSEPLYGKRVVVVADNDESGKAHAREVCRALIGKVRTLRLIESLPGVGPKGDFTEWVRNGGTADDFLQLLGETTELTTADVQRWGEAPAYVPGVLASDVTPEAVQWLWANHIPQGKITIFDGDPGVGKSCVTLDLTARITRGDAMPDGSGPEISAAGVVVVSLEDGVADTIVPRLMAAGADLSKVRIVDTIKGPDGVSRTPTIPIDLPAIQAAAKDVNAAAVILDPLVATLGEKTNSYEDQDVRRALAPVKALAEQAKPAVLCVRHLNKSNSPNPKYRGGGSIGLTGVARANFLFREDPDEPGSFVMAWSKGNLSAPPDSMKYTLQTAGRGLAVRWSGTSPHTARAILAEPEGEEESNACADAKDFLLEALANGPVDPKEVTREARIAGHSDKTLRRAKNILGIKAHKVGFERGAHWEWQLPKMANNQNLATFEQVSETKPFNSIDSTKMAKPENMAIFDSEVGHLRDESKAEEMPVQKAKEGQI